MKTEELLSVSLRESDFIYEASILISEVRFILRGADMTKIRCRIWFDLDPHEYRYELSHELPGMNTNSHVSGDSPESVLNLALKRFSDYRQRALAAGHTLELNANAFFDDPNAI